VDGKWIYFVRGTPALGDQPPAISPDGEQIAIALNDGGRRRIHVMEKDGTKRKPLSKQVDARGAPAWSRDGSCVLTGGVDGMGREGLYEFHVAKGSVRPILPVRHLARWEDHRLRLGRGQLRRRAVRAGSGRGPLTRRIQREIRYAAGFPTTPRR
jgi:WD40-like Beta Propeller Repeat